jgi:ribosomal-protein-alanine N-acetyltransferase
MSGRVIVSTPRLRLLPFGDRHLTVDYVGWLNDHELRRFSQQRERVHTPQSCRDYVRSFQGTPNHFVAIERKIGSPSYVGTATIYVDIPSSAANLGILIGAHPVLRQGFGTEAWIGLMHFTFETLGLRKIEAGTLSVNFPMLRVFAKAGMTFDDRTSPVIWDGREVHLIHAYALRTDWTAPIPIENVDGSKNLVDRQHF